MASRRPLLLRFNRQRTVARSRLRPCITCVLLLASAAPLLPNLLVPSAHAQSTPTQYVTRVWHTEEGLPQNSVNAMLQDHRGYIWIGTFGGLARFDGERFTVFDSANTPGFGSDQFLTVRKSLRGIVDRHCGWRSHPAAGWCCHHLHRTRRIAKQVGHFRPRRCRRAGLDQHGSGGCSAFCWHKAGSLSHSQRKSGPGILFAGAGRKQVVPLRTRCCAFRSRWLHGDPAFHPAERFFRTRGSRRKCLGCFSRPVSSSALLPGRILGCSAAVA